PENHYQSLVRLCQAVSSAHDLGTVFRQAAEAIREATACAHVSLVLPPDGCPAQPGLAVEFTEPPRGSEVPAPGGRSPAVQLVLGRGRARVVRCRDADAPVVGDHNYRAWLYLPLVCRGDAVGVLGLAARHEDGPERWDRDLLEGMSSLLALALDGLA